MSDKLQRVLQQIDAINQEDPNQEQVDGNSVAKEFIYGQRMSSCLAEIVSSRR